MFVMIFLDQLQCAKWINLVQLLLEVLIFVHLLYAHVALAACIFRGFGKNTMLCMNLLDSTCSRYWLLCACVISVNEIKYCTTIFPAALCRCTFLPVV